MTHTMRHSRPESMSSFQDVDVTFPTFLEKLRKTRNKHSIVHRDIEQDMRAFSKDLFRARRERQEHALNKLREALTESEATRAFAPIEEGIAFCCKEGISHQHKLIHRAKAIIALLREEKVKRD